MSCSLVHWTIRREAPSQGGWGSLALWYCGPQHADFELMSSGGAPCRVEAAIVRIMKTRKALSHHELVAEVRVDTDWQMRPLARAFSCLTFGRVALDIPGLFCTVSDSAEALPR
jgi:hypothetical protein